MPIKQWFEHQFAANGKYIVKLTGMNECDSLTREKEITVDYAIANDFDYTAQDLTLSYTVDPTYLEGVYWSFGDGASSQELAPVHTYATNGVYTVSLSMYSVPEVHTITKEIQVGSGAGIDDNMAGRQLNIYPNPASGSVTINSLYSELVSIYTMQGQLVKQQRLQQGDNTVDISSIDRGIYLVACHGELSKLIVR